MADKKVTKILLSKTNMTVEEIAALSDTEARRIVNSLPRKKRTDNRPRICFTGFKDTDKEILKEIAEGINFRVVESVTDKLTCLCVGIFPDQIKLRKAAELSTPIIDGYEFVDLSEFGVVPENLRGVINLTL